MVDRRLQSSLVVLAYLLYEAGLLPASLLKIMIILPPFEIMNLHELGRIE
jgi:hypothetical protein